MSLPPRPCDKARIAVIGGGFSGAVFALQLARRPIPPCSITIIEPRATLGAGVAYGTCDPAHRINVPAARMIIFPEDPTDFDRWFRAGAELAEDPEALWPDGHAYPRRAAFGRYIADLLEASLAARPDLALVHYRGAAVAVGRYGPGYTIALDDGSSLEADLVVLATSHPPPSPPALVAAALGDDRAVITDPWAPDALAGIAATDDVLVIGTGLTMADTVASLTLQGHRGRITAFSRRGLLSRGHADFNITYPWFATHEPPRSARALLRQLRQLIDEAARKGIPWQAVIDDVRGQGRRVWCALPAVERARLLRHLRPFWDVHRYRVAPQVEAIIERRREDGSLRVQAASLRALKRENGKIVARLQPRHKPPRAAEVILVDKLVVTTGPAHGSVIVGNPALASLERAGLITADPLALGIAVNSVSETIGRDGVSNETLVVAGPLAREQYGELMGLPQVSAHALEVATRIGDWLVRCAAKNAVT